MANDPLIVDGKTASQIVRAYLEKERRQAEEEARKPRPDKPQPASSEKRKQSVKPQPAYTQPASGLILPSAVTANPSSYIQVPQLNYVIAREESHKGKMWQPSLDALAADSMEMPAVNIFMQHFINVRDAAAGKIQLYDASGSAISQADTEDLWKYLSTGHRTGCWTWLNASFREGSGHGNLDLVIHKLENGNLVKHAEPLESHAPEGYVSLDFNSQGFPVSRAKKQEYKQGKNIYLWNPLSGRVARFNSWADRACLGCCRGPQVSDGGLGTFACAAGAAPKI